MGDYSNIYMILKVNKEVSMRPALVIMTLFVDTT